MRNCTELRDHKTDSSRNPYRLYDNKNSSDIQGRALLDFIRLDIFSDVCGRAPLSSVNYVYITNFIIALFKELEDRFRKARHPLWVLAYEQPAKPHKRLMFVTLVMGTEDKEAMGICAQVFEDCRCRLGSFMFWNLMDEEVEVRRRERDREEVSADQCMVT